MPQPVIDAVLEHFQLEVSKGGYEAAELHASRIERFYPCVAQLLHCSPLEIAFVENATRAWDLAFYSIKFQRGDRVLTSEAEYSSNYLALLQTAKNKGIVIEVLPNDETGQLSIRALKERIGKDVKLIAITHIPAHGGLVNPVELVGDIAQQAGVFYLLDATQSLGQMPLDVKKIGCDALCATGRKYLRGPRGTGFLYVSKNRLQQMEPPFLDCTSATWTGVNAYCIQNDAKRFETWERSYSHMIGLTAAIDYALKIGLEGIWERIQALASLLRQRLKEIPKVTLCDQGVVQCGIMTMIIDGYDSFEIKNHLLQKGIHVSVSTSENARLDLGRRGIKSVVRASVHYYNSEEEIERFCKEVEKF